MLGTKQVNKVSPRTPKGKESKDEPQIAATHGDKNIVQVETAGGNKASDGPEDMGNQNSIRFPKECMERTAVKNEDFFPTQ